MVIVRIWEGLGNQMFQYAYARALREKGMEVGIDLKKAYDGSFKRDRSHDARQNTIQNYKITLPQIDVERYGKYKYLRRETAKDKLLFWMGEHSALRYRFYEEEELRYSEKLASLSGNYYVKGWFQNERYFYGIRDILLREFVPRNKIRIPESLRKAMKYEESVSIHIRRTDYVRTQNTLSMTYYYKAIEYLRAFYKRPVFLVFSDDLDWAKGHLQIDADVLFVNEDGRLQDYEELLIMSRCSSNIIANSTFSWWAAWLNRNEEKHVVAPRKWFPGQGQIIPKEWVVV